MSGPPTSSRGKLQSIHRKTKKSVSDPGKGNPTIVDSKEVQVDHVVDSQNDVEDSQSSLTGYRDLFGELIPTSSTPVANDKSIKKKSTRKKKQPYEELFKNSSRSRPTHVFFPTPRIIRVLKESQRELYSLMGLNNSSSEISDVSSDSNDVSGVQQLLESPTPSAQKKTRTDLSNNENNKELPLVFTGVSTFVDYKNKNDNSGSGIKHRLDQLGAKVEKTFNKRVQYVVFMNGLQKTYDTAIERKIPLVSAMWIKKCYLNNKILDPVNYPPLNIEKYTVKRPVNYDHPKYNTYKKFLKQPHLDSIEFIRLKYNIFKKRLKKLCIEYPSQESNENCKTSDTSITIKEPEEPDQKFEIIDSIFDQLSEVLNKEDSPESNDKIDERHIPKSIKRLSQYLVSDVKKKPLEQIIDDLNIIEDYLNLNSRARKRLRKYLFCSNEELDDKCSLDDTNDVNNISLRSFKKTKNCSQSKLINKNKRKIVLDYGDSEVLPCKKSLTKTLTKDTSLTSLTPTNYLDTSKLLMSISCTGMKNSDVDIIKLHIKDLGTFAYCSKVVSSTKYLVMKSLKKRTLNMIYAMALGCYIISDNWVYESHKIGRWLPHEQYLILDLSKSVKEFQIQRNTLGSSAKFNIFNDVGLIYLAKTCKPSAKTLKELIHICGGTCINVETIASVVIGSTPHMNNNISEKWILDCIIQGSLLNKCEYMLVNNIITHNN